MKAKPPLLPEELGSPPRATYPLVVLLALAEAEEFEAEDPSAIVCRYTIIHVPCFHNYANFHSHQERKQCLPLENILIAK